MDEFHAPLAYEEVHYVVYLFKNRSGPIPEPVNILLEQTTVTRADGSFSLEGLPPSDCLIDVVVDADGPQAKQAEGVERLLEGNGAPALFVVRGDVIEVLSGDEATSLRFNNSKCYFPWP